MGPGMRAALFFAACSMAAFTPRVTAAERLLTIAVVGVRVEVTQVADPAPVYLTLNNYGGGDKLIGAQSIFAESVEIHDFEKIDAVETMKQVHAVEIPDLKIVHFQPGGPHLMIFGLHEEALTAGTATIVLKFQKAGEISVEAAVVNPATLGPAPNQEPVRNRSGRGPNNKKKKSKKN